MTVRSPLPWIALLSLNSEVQAAHCLFIGDSLTKEYDVEFPALYLSKPAAWSTGLGSTSDASAPSLIRD